MKNTITLELSSKDVEILLQHLNPHPVNAFDDFDMQDFYNIVAKIEKTALEQNSNLVTQFCG